ncbi:hypothetical protein H2277_06880 [Campylobacter sp. W0014]|uniref:hypothetical protein n=1 Tax=Campylobacter sp. W0014 TaxID=2735781 RepID=UPI001EC8EF11|nr:hypothetical protein [Campylobacter sp. W0014]
MNVSLFNDEVKAYIKNYHSIVNFLSFRYGLEFDKAGNERHNKSLKIKTNTCLITDFNGSFSGDIVDFIAFKENVNIKEALEIFSNFCNVSTNKEGSFKLQKEPLKDNSYLKNMAYSLQANFNLANEEFIRCRALEKAFFSDFRFFMHFCKLNFLKDDEFESTLKEYFAFSKDDKSLAFILRDKDIIKSIAIREKNFNGEPVKWFKIKGSSNKFIKLIKAKEKGLLKDYCFIFSGIKEIITSELLGLNAICFQSDSMMKNIHLHEQKNELLNLIDNKRIVFIVENDKSSFEANLGFLRELIQLMPLKKGYCVFNFDEEKNADFVDFLAFLMKELRQDFQKNNENFSNFFAYMEKHFKSYFIKKMNLFLKVVK